ncbi:MAG: hypothetical protein ACI85V_000867 [bacterium]
MIASGIIASIGDGHQFSNGYEFSAWLGRLATVAIAALSGIQRMPERANKTARIVWAV